MGGCFLDGMVCLSEGFLVKQCTATMGAFLNEAAGLLVFLGFLDLRALSTGGSIVLVYNPGYLGAFLAVLR